MELLKKYKSFLGNRFFHKAAGECLRATITQDQMHVTPFHKYCAIRLVLEGGFRPESVHPETPFVSKAKTQGIYRLGLGDIDDEKVNEAVVLGHYNSKQVDVTVRDRFSGPKLGVSVKTTNRAFSKNMINRSEEFIGDAVNIHSRYPAFVYGYLHIVPKRTIKEVEKDDNNFSSGDASFEDDGRATDLLERFRGILEKIDGRSRIGDPHNIYESVGLVVIQRDKSGCVTVNRSFPPPSSSVHIDNFFSKLYKAYDKRHVPVTAKSKFFRKRWWLYEQKTKGGQIGELGTKIVEPVVVESHSFPSYHVRERLEE